MDHHLLFVLDTKINLYSGEMFETAVMESIVKSHVALQGATISQPRGIRISAKLDHRLQFRLQKN